MTHDEFYRLWNNYIEQRLLDIEMWAAINALGIKPTLGHNRLWWFEYTDSESGKLIIGWGESVYEAAKNFYDELRKPLEKY